MLLFGAKAAGADFSSMATLGQQEFFPSLKPLQKAFRLHGISKDAKTFIHESGSRSEPLFRLLGATSIVSFDSSDYEGASDVQDLNKPLADKYVNRFSVVYDGSTLEHVFNLPEALSSCMNMLKVGGYFISSTMANNYLGHGFYQFSPELMHRVFCERNGFSPHVVLVYENRKNGRWFKTRDPETMGRRCERNSSPPLLICTVAKKISAVRPFSEWPQQSDYFRKWTDKPLHEPGTGDMDNVRKQWAGIKRCVPAFIKDRMRPWLYAKSRRWGQGDAFQLLPDELVIRGKWD
jgi:hypothetical protein